MKNWRQLAKEKSAIDQQTEEIHQKFRMDKINKEFGQLSGEEVFKPVTKRLDRSATVEEEEEEEEEEEQEVPDYTMDEFDKLTRLVSNSDRMHQLQHHHHQQHQQQPQHQ